jgi:hypothetical protein
LAFDLTALVLVGLRFVPVLVRSPNRAPEHVLTVRLRWLDDLSVNLVVAISECDALAQNKQAECYDGRSVAVHDCAASERPAFLHSLWLSLEAVSEEAAGKIGLVCARNLVRLIWLIRCRSAVTLCHVIE